jgi:hypothetical protein
LLPQLREVLWARESLGRALETQRGREQVWDRRVSDLKDELAGYKAQFEQVRALAVEEAKLARPPATGHGPGGCPAVLATILMQPKARLGSGSGMSCL